MFDAAVEELIPGELAPLLNIKRQAYGLTVCFSIRKKRIIVDLMARTGAFETDLDRASKLADKKAKEIDPHFADTDGMLAKLPPKPASQSSPTESGAPGRRAGDTSGRRLTLNDSRA